MTTNYWYTQQLLPTYIYNTINRRLFRDTLRFTLFAFWYLCKTFLLTCQVTQLSLSLSLSLSLNIL